MAGPFTVNSGLIVATTGSLVDTWGDAALNPDFVAIDGLFSGIQTIAVSNTDVTLTSPSGFTATPTPGPTQAQNRVLRFTGALTNDIIVNLPLPGVYVIENLTTGAHTIRFRGLTFTEQVCVDQGARQTIYNDGANVRFVDLGSVGQMEFWAGLSAMPAWVGICTVPPYLLCDAVISNFAQFPYLGARMGAAFGGNGTTTFGVPDLRGRVPLAYDGTGMRITAAGSGLNGQTLGAVLDKQTNTLVTGNLPPYTPAGTATFTGNPMNNVLDNLGSTTTGGGGFSFSYPANQSSPAPTGTVTFTGTPAPGQISTPVNNVQPSQVAGIWVIKT